jgi:hypothetical protein
MLKDEIEKNLIKKGFNKATQLTSQTRDLGHKTERISWKINQLKKEHKKQPMSIR